MQDAGTPRHEPSVADSVIRVIEAGQRLILNRLDLAYFDLSQLAVRTLHGTALIAIGAVLVASAWFVFLLGVVAWLRDYLPLPAALFIVAGLNVVGGVTALLIGVRRTRTTAAAKLGDMVADLRGTNVDATSRPRWPAAAGGAHS